MNSRLWLATFVVFAAARLSATTRDLAGRWRLSGSDERGEAVTCPIIVPGGVHDALKAAGRMVDPFWGANEGKTQWVSEREWTLTRSFTADAALLSSPLAVLRLEDVDTFATVYVNGVEAGRCGNRFARYDFDVKKLLRAGENELKVVFASAPAEIRRRVAASPIKAPIADMGLYPYINYIRKPDCHQGWDWGLAQMNVGLCGKVELIVAPFTVDYVYSEQQFNDELSSCRLTVFAETTHPDGRRTTYTNRFEIANPPLWWPNGMGERKFYEYELDIEGVKLRRRIGLRKLEVVSEEDSQGGRSLVFKVNGRALFAKGANWIPCSAFENEQTSERYRDLLGSAAEANMNMIRLWGGGQFEKDVFYNTCDELGLLVWHDFMFACETSPGEKNILDEIETELAHQLRRLRDHASIALWCGDNESRTAHRWWYRQGNPRDRKWKPLPGGEKTVNALATNYLARVRLEDRLVRRYDPTRTFWPSSPSSGLMDEVFAEETEGRGDIHIWSVWQNGWNFEQYYDPKVRFCSEFGWQSFPSPEVVRTFCPPEACNPTDPLFEAHQKSGAGNGHLLKTIAERFRMPLDTDGICYLSQIQQALAVKTAVEKWRTRAPYCTGALYWQLNDNWPATSWSSLEYGGAWKHLHYHARRFYSPVAAFVTPVDSLFDADLELFVVNDSPKAVDGELLLETYDFSGRRLASESFRRSFASGVNLLARRKKAEFGGEEERSGKFLAVTLRTEEGVFRNEFFFDTFKNSPVAEAEVRYGVRGFDVTLSASKPAFFVWADALGIAGEFSDNSFTLRPDEPRTITFRPKDPSVSEADFASALVVRSLAGRSVRQPTTFCNPLPIEDYPLGMYCRGIKSGTPPKHAEHMWLTDDRKVWQYRGLADPTLLCENGVWYLYPSADLCYTSADGGATWRHVPLGLSGAEGGEDMIGYAPTVCRHRDRYLLVGGAAQVFEGETPTGPFRRLGTLELPKWGENWDWTGDPPVLSDADFFSDDDGRLYLYWGCTPTNGIWGVELDADNPLKLISTPKRLVTFDPESQPWEVLPGSDPKVGYVEGAWMIKHDGRYVLTYSAAGTENREYAMGQAIGASPLGPFVKPKANPFFRKTEGLVTGTGHGSVVKGPDGAYWVAYTITGKCLHWYERRIGLDRIRFAADGTLAVGEATEEPQWLPGYGEGPTGWKRLAATPAAGAEAATDGRLSTFWNPGEVPVSLNVDLAAPHTIRASRIIWHDCGLDTERGVGKGPYRYRLIARDSAGNEQTLVDASDNTRDLLIDYRETEPLRAVSVRLDVLSAPPGVLPGITDFAVFGI